MALNLEDFKRISEKEKNSVFGYIRMMEKEYMFEIPMIVYQICALFCMIYHEWSPECKGDKIILSENNTKATIQSGNQSIRAKNPILKGMYVKLNFICGGGRKTLEIIGVISSEFDEKNGFNKIPYFSGDILQYCYGADCFYDSSCSNKHYFDGEYKDLGWTLGLQTTKKSQTICMIIDYKTYDTCCLSYYIDGQFKGPKDAKYSMKLPELKNDHVWYPITSFYNRGRWCKIECVDCVCVQIFFVNCIDFILVQNCIDLIKFR